ncbi:type II toxin-antitoxin system VapC family toxin [Candidatus Bathyarchaeota archaeon]|nr:type II toxin-antitoxin system VapC family toxin [Candidatus Bathyarchaeota archaeon]
MRYLLDASALLNIVRRLGERSLKILKENYILTLTIYEVGNALWRETKLLKKLTTDEAEEIMKAVIALTKFMQIIEPEDPTEILKTSNKIEATFYDTAYVVVALRRNLTLVTDDKKLVAKIERYQDAILKEHKRKLHVIRSTDL